MKINLIHLLLILLIWSCSQPELELDNKFDTGNPDFIAPETTIEGIPSLINLNTIQINWTGNEPNMEFQHKLDEGDWSEWDEITTGIFSYLNEGFHTLLVRGRYQSGTEEDAPDTLDFEVDAIGGSSIWIKNLYTKVSNQDTFSVEIIAEEVEPIAGAGIIVKFTELGLNLDSLIIGDFFEINDIKPIAFDTITVSAGNSVLNLDIANIGGSVSGTGTIATLFFKAKSIGQHKIIINEETKLKDENNDEIEWEVLEDGMVDVIE